MWCEKRILVMCVMSRTKNGAIMVITIGDFSEIYVYAFGDYVLPLYRVYSQSDKEIYRNLVSIN